MTEIPSPLTDRFDILRWRRGERERLISERLAIPIETRSVHGDSIARRLDAVLPDLVGRTISLYWPLKGEPDLRDWLARIVARGADTALPVVVERNQPMQFRRWRPDEPLTRGIWNIPIPETGVAVIPEIILAPIVGLDAQGYRLGYGGGYFDRTLAAQAAPAKVIAIGYSAFRLPTIHPLPHDIPMNAFISETEAVEFRPFR